MPAGPVFPAFLKLEYRDDGSAKGAFLSAVDSTLNSAEKRFAEFGKEAGRQLDAALATQRTPTGALDLNVAGQRAAADAARARAVAARELATATQIAARENGDFSASTRLAVQALQAQAREEDQAAAAALSHARALEQVQQVLNRQAGAVTTLTGATRRSVAVNDNLTVSAGQQRAAYQQLSFQLGDVSQGLALGTPLAIIFAQQIGQVTQAVQLMGGTGAIGAAARFLSGGWGIALSVGAVALSPLIGKLFETAAAADQVKFSTNAVGDAQSILGGVLDIATGKINTQSSALIGLAKAQLLVAQVQARTRAADARRGVADIQSRPVRFTGGGLGGGFSAGRRDVDARDTISAQVLAGTLDSSAAVQRLENLRRVGRLTDDEFSAAAASVANLGVELKNLEVYGDATKLLDGTGGTSLLKPGKAKTPRKGRTGDGGAAGREEFGEDARDRIAGIAEGFSKVPSAVREAIKSTRTLQDIIDDLARKRPVNWEATIAEAKAAKAAIADAIVRPFQDAERNANRQFDIQRLTLAGRFAEAAAVESIFTLEEKLGSEEVLRAKVQSLLTAGRKDEAAVIEQILAAYPALKQQARDLADLEERRGEALKRAQEIQSAYLGATRSVRQEVEAILSGTGKLSNFKQIFRQLQGKILTEQIFGPIFKKIESAVLKDTGIDAAVDKLAKDTTQAGNSALAFADTLDEATRRIRDAAPGPAPLGTANAAAGINAGIALVGTAIFAAGNRGKGGLQPNGDILVPRNRLPKDTVAGMTPGSYADLVANELTRPLLKGLDGLVPGLSDVIGGALGGYVTGGIPGGVIGALKNLTDLSTVNGRILNAKLGEALEGATTGTAVAGIAKALGIGKFSTTGSQVGGAVGQAVGGPIGGLVGSIAGGFIGGLFKKAKTGSATLSVGADGVQVGGTGGNSGSRKKAASGLGDGISDSLNRIAEQLGGSADGPISVSIGIRDKNFRVDTSGGGATKKSKGAIDFGTDQEAAIRFAIADAIKDGVITGITAGAQALLRSGKDIEAQVQKAIDFESVFTRLRAFKDPVGAALDTLDKEFGRLKSIFTEAGASAAEYADLEKLYGSERAVAVKSANEAIAGSLRSLYQDLTIGNDARSLRDRKGLAQAAYDPLAARVAAGDTTAFDDFSEAARALLEIERQFSGSQGGYFALADQVTSLTKARLDGLDAVAAASTGRDSPFSNSSVPIRDNQGVIDAVNDQTGQLGSRLDAVNQNLGAILALTGRGSEPVLLQARGYF